MKKPSTAIVGVDGCKAGWIAIYEREGVLSVELWPELTCLFRSIWESAMVDMPLGLLAGRERRACDLAARKLLGKKRSSVFFTPPRECLDATDYEQVRTQGMSLQTFYILPKIRELDSLAKPADQSWLGEAHPELAYHTRSSLVLAKKRTALGREQRQGILRGIGSPFILEEWSGQFLRKDVALDDLLDAAILLEVARSRTQCVASMVGDGTKDARGQEMVIWY